MAMMNCAIRGRGQRVENAEECELALRRQRRFGLVENEDAVLESVLEQGEKRFAVRLRVERCPTVASERGSDRLQICREVEERPGAQEESVSASLSPRQRERTAEGVAVGVLLVSMIATATLRAEPHARARGHGSDQGV